MRTKSLLASIFGTVANAVNLIINSYAIFILWVAFSIANSGNADQTGEASAIAMVAVFAVMELLLITALVLTCVTFSYVGASHEKYQKRKGVTISTIVFDAVICAISIVLIASSENIVSTILYTVFAIALFVSCVLYIVDLIEEKHKIVEVKNDGEMTATLQENVQSTEEKESNKN